MKNFNINRFGRTMLWNLKTSKNEFLTIMTTLASTFLSIQLFAMLFSWGRPAAVVSESIDGTGQLTLGVLAVFCLNAGCWMFNNMKTKAQRIGFKMLPATDLEKFLTRFIYVSVFLVIGSFVAFIVADVVRMLVCLLFYGDTLCSTIPFLFENIHPQVNLNTLNDAWAERVLAFAILLFFNAFAVLGGTFFRRRQVILTCLSAILLVILLMTVLVKIHDNIEFSIGDDEIAPSAWVVSVILVALSATMYRLSYWLFRRMQVINNKWLNV